MGAYTVNFDQTLAQVNITLSDTNNVTFSPEEKTRATQKAWNDSSVVEEYWDSSLTFDRTISDYTKPSGVDNILDIYIYPDNTNITNPQKIAQDLWEDFGGYIRFKNYAAQYIEDGYSLYIKSWKKLDYDADSITGKNLQEYVIALASWETLGMLGYKKANLFLKNDTSMGELVTLRRELQREVVRLRSSLPRAFVSV